MVNKDSLYALPLAFPPIAAIAGARSKDAERPWRAPLIGALLATVVVGVLAATTHRHGVSVTDLIKGSVGAGVMLGALPVCVYFALGRALAGHFVVLGLVCAASVVPVGYYYLIGWIVTLAFTHCPPDAYECPV